MDEVVDQGGQEKEMTVGLSFTAPLSVAQWVQEYMRAKGIGRSEAIVEALELLKQQEALAA